MTEQEKLYEVFGELLYAIAKADGIIQPEEKDALGELLQKHAWASEIKWSFNYEASKNSSVEEVYNKVINF
ncbi:MAG: TerB family tellurite resistance protein, partial [Flavobacteriales bacterium]|nr:TerB family tellurite resistance protein [Flavobacteriales bacterium]